MLPVQRLDRVVQTPLRTQVALRRERIVDAIRPAFLLKSGQDRLLVRGRYLFARVSAAIAVVAVLFGWAAGQYPYMLEQSLKISDAAGAHATLVAILVVFGAGSLLLVPALVWLYTLMQRGMLTGEH